MNSFRLQNYELCAKKPSISLDTLQSPNFSIIAGSTGLTILLINRLALGLEGVSDVQSRLDIVSVIACSAVLLNALSEFEIEARERDAVGLVGYALRKPVVFRKGSEGNALKWLCNALIGPLPITSLHIIDAKGSVFCRAGVVGMGDELESKTLNINNMPILNKGFNGEEVYLPDLQILPGKIEFSYLPVNCQSVLIFPLDNDKVAIMGTNQAKIIKLDDLAKIRLSLDVFEEMITS